MEDEANDRQRQGIKLAFLICSGWLVSLLVALILPVDKGHPIVVIVAVGLRTFLQTGLFIVAHDAMHGSLAIEQPKLNRQIGHWCLVFYAGLSFSACKANHQRHHLAPATEMDPDFGGLNNTSVLNWYLNFLSNYLCAQQLLKLGLIWTFFYLFANKFSPQPGVSIGIFCILPLVFSSLQLFLFGTYLPHRKTDPLKSEQTRSLYLPTLLSIASCYHFGYHREHHDNPTVPWFQLPTLRTTNCRCRTSSLNYSKV